MIQYKKNILSGDYTNPGDFTEIFDHKEFTGNIIVTPSRGFFVVGGSYTDGYIDIVKIKMPVVKNDYTFKVYLKNRKTESVYLKKLNMINEQDKLFDYNGESKISNQDVMIYTYLQTICNDFECDKLVKPNYKIKVKGL